MHVVVRADGGPDLGYGHLVRTGALAERLLVGDHRVTYATTTPSHVADAAPAGVESIELPSRSDVRPLLDRLPADADVVALDSYAADTGYQAAIREARPLALVSDDADEPVCADLLLDGNLHAQTLDYEVEGDAPRRCLGPDYLLLRSAIARLADREPPWREEPERALVTMGGSDTAEVTPIVVRAFDDLALHVDAIVGPGFSGRQEREIRAVAEGVAADVRVVRNPDDLPDRMFEADLAVATASTTTYELLALGTPIATCAVAPNQRPLADALRERDAAVVVEPPDDEAAFADAIDRYVASPALRRTHRRTGRECVDGHGAERVVGELRRLVDRRR